MGGSILGIEAIHQFLKHKIKKDFYFVNNLQSKIDFFQNNKKNYLANLASEISAEIIEHKNFIGGRYSVLSEVGMLPAELMGLN